MRLLSTEETLKAIQELRASKSPFEIPEGTADWVIEDVKKIQNARAAKAQGMSKTLLEHALDCVRRGWFVFPCYPRSKAPAGSVVPHGVLDASNDEAVVRSWWATNPNFNPAIALGPSGLVVYDFDSIKPFENLPPTFTVKTGRVEKDGIGGIQMYFRGSCKTHGHTGGGGEVRSRGAYVMAPGAIHPSGNPYAVVSDLPLADSPEKNQDESKPTAEAVGTDDQNAIGAYVEAAFHDCEIDYQARVANNEGGFKWFIACPWKSEHTTGKDFDTSTAVIMWPSGKLIYECKHGHCQGIRQWKQLREWMEAKVGHFLVFGGSQSGTVLFGTSSISENGPTASTAGPISNAADEDSEDSIPPFDPSVINGIYKKFVNVVTRGTTLAPQFAYVIAKTFLGLRMAGKVRFNNLDVEPRYYTALIGETGSGKGEAYRRVERILYPEGVVGGGCRIKKINSADSGVGIKDLFFEPPEDWPVLCYTDEIDTLGNKSTGTRNPSILDVMIELADSTSVSRVLSKSRGGTKSKNGARLGMILCGPSGLDYTKAFAGRKNQGLWDRFYPEFGVPQLTGSLPRIDEKTAFELLAEFNSLDYSGEMNMAPEAEVRLDEFWNQQSVDVQKKARWKKNLTVDAYMSAFGRGARTVETSDVDIAIKIFTRQVVIRRVCFTTEVPDKVGYYLGLIKRITERMSRQLAAGMAPEVVAKSRRDFETQSNAYRDNEVHVFERAWNVFAPVWLDRVKIKKANGQEYVKYLPGREE